MVSFSGKLMEPEKGVPGTSNSRPVVRCIGGTWIYDWRLKQEEEATL